MQRSELAGNGPAGEATARPDEPTTDGTPDEQTRNDDPAEDTALNEPTEPGSSTTTGAQTDPATTPGADIEPDAPDQGASSAQPFKPSPRPRSAPAGETPAGRSEPEPPATADDPPVPPAAAEDSPTPTDQSPAAADETPTTMVQSPAAAEDSPDSTTDPAPDGGERTFKPSPRPRSTSTEVSVEPPPAPAPAEAEVPAQPSTEQPSTEQPSTEDPPSVEASPAASSPGWGHLASDDHPTDDRTTAGAGDDQVGQTRDGAPVRKRWVRRIGVAAATILLMLFIPAFIVRMYGIPSESMETTLHGCAGCDNDRVLVDRTVYRFRDPHPGEVVVFNAGPEIWGNSEEQDPGESNPLVRGLQSLGEKVGIAPPSGPDFVKRVIAVGGQTVSCCDSRNRVVVDGVPVDEPYVYFSLAAGPAKQAPFPKIKVPDGMMWMMGDNRNASLDSRAPGNGPVPLSALAGKVRAIIYPFSRIGSVDDTNPQKPR